WRTTTFLAVPARRFPAAGFCAAAARCCRFVRCPAQPVGARWQSGRVPRVTLSRLSDDRVLVVESDAPDRREPETIAAADLAAYVTRRELEEPRWVWDDTARWYPPLLAAGVRITRCHDLRLGRQILRSAPAVDAALLTGEE